MITVHGLEVAIVSLAIGGGLTYYSYRKLKFLLSMSEPSKERDRFRDMTRLMVLNGILSAIGYWMFTAVLTDVGTLKAPVIDAVRRVIPSARFVGGHPLAGTENTGWAAADPLLFRDAPWALTLETDTDLDAWLALAELVCDLGAKPVPATTSEQDAAVARIIGLPHVLAEVLALVGLGGGPMGLSLAAGSYMSGSRVARPRAVTSAGSAG